jgi:hypothetical protein
MEPKFYTVSKIEGDYATLTGQDGNEMFIAMALLPPNTDIGTKLRYFMFEYEIAE